MKIGYTEFSYGYAFTENLIRSSSSGPTTAPVFPNLVQEATSGFDVQIDLPGQPLFFQYKLPELMTRNAAKEISTHHLANISVPFFRMPLMRRDLSDQHQILIDLEHSFPGSVFYATPCLPHVHAFNAAYAARRVHRRSAFFSPAEIGPLPDDKFHSIAYRPGMAYGWFCSTPKTVQAFSVGVVQEKAASRFDQPLRSTARDMQERVLSLGVRMGVSLDAVRREVRERKPPGTADVSAAEENNVIEDILVTREVACVALGLDMVIAQPRAPEPPAGMVKQEHIQ
jgi:hypothetical protein